jgi:hypothetical protein
LNNPKPKPTETGEENMKNAFEYGQAVAITGSAYPHHTGKVGYVVHRMGDNILVNLGTGFDGHDGNGYSGIGDASGKGKGHCWWVPNRDLIAVTLPVGTAKPKRATKKAVKLDDEGKPALNPQTKQVLAMLEAKGSLTALEASGVLRVRALPRRIADLKEAGYKIVRVLSKDTTGQRYARYYLRGTAERVAA